MKEFSVPLLVFFIGLGLLIIRYVRHWNKHIKRINSNKQMVKGIQLDESLTSTEHLALISLLVAAWNEEGRIEQLIDSFLSLNYPSKELILIAGGDDRTLAIASKYKHPQITILEQQRGEGKFRSLKRGLLVAKGSIIYLTDADCRLTTEAFLRVVHPIVKGKEIVVTGRFCPFLDQLSNPFVYAQWKKRQFYEQRNTNNTYLHSLTGANCAIDRKVLAACWQAISEQSTGEDHYLGLWVRKAGYQIFEARDSYIETQFPDTIKAYIRQQSRWLRSWTILDYRFGEKQWYLHVATILKAQVIVFMPFLVPFIGWEFGLQFFLICAVLWLLAWVHFFMPYALTKWWRLMGNQTDIENTKHLSLFTLYQLMIADFFSRVIVLPQLLVSQWRKSW